MPKPASTTLGRGTSRGRRGGLPARIGPLRIRMNRNPQSWNLYSYTRNNPLRFVDPDGQRVQICITGGQCFEVEDRDYPGLQPGNPGVVLPNFNFGRDEISVKGITCGGQNCGTATYLNDSPGLTPVLNPIWDFREQIAPINPRSWIIGALRNGVKVAAAQQGGQRPKIHTGKQGKHVPGHNNFQTGRSELSHGDPQGYLTDSPVLAGKSAIPRRRSISARLSERGSVLRDSGYQRREGSFITTQAVVPILFRLTQRETDMEKTSTLTEELAKWRHWAGQASRDENGWESDAPNWPRSRKILSVN